MDNNSLIKPDLQFSIVCDSIRREDNGKMMFIGIFEVIGAKNFPVTHNELFIANRWIKGMGNFTEKTRIMSSKDNKVAVETKDVSFELKAIESSHTVISKFMNIVFHEPGKYQIEVLLNNEVVRCYPLVIAQEPLA
ncbi:MAG: hypothetical protein NTV71_01375 [Candidatus Omnitrophica bacterium]|nr:hypothetical protein [Candidatus Omnitrophota bacterium]